jgi:hypothetical protein
MFSKTLNRFLRKWKFCFVQWLTDFFFCWKICPLLYTHLWRFFVELSFKFSSVLLSNWSALCSTWSLCYPLMVPGTRYAMWLSLRLPCYLSSNNLLVVVCLVIYVCIRVADPDNFLSWYEFATLPTYRLQNGFTIIA